jgi:hypothetical protein
VPPGAIADEDNVIVRVDDARDQRPAPQVDNPGALSPDVVADRGKTAVANEGLRHDPVVRIHSVDPAVAKGEIGAGHRLLRVCVRDAEAKRHCAAEEFSA